MKRPEVWGAALSVLALTSCSPKMGPSLMERCERPAIHDVDTREQQEEHRSVLVLTGAGATYKGNRAIANELEKEYGESNVKVYNSTISPEGGGSDRFKSIGEFIQLNLDRGRVSVIAHSSGAAEFALAIDYIEQNQPGFFDNPENARKMDLTLISPSGVSGFFTGPRSTPKYAIRLFKELLNEQPISPFPSVYRGIMSATTFPPKNMSREALEQGLRETLHDYSHHTPEIPIFEYSQTRKFNKNLPEDVQEKMQEIDGDLQAALAVGDRKKVKKLLRSRGQLTKKPMADVYGGSDQYIPDPFSVPKESGWTWSAVSGAYETFKGVFSTELIERVNKLRAKGAKIQVIIPEYDRNMKAKEARDVFCPDEVSVMPGATHYAPFTPQPDISKKALENMK